MKKKNFLKKGMILALSLSMILPQSSMNLMASETESTEAVSPSTVETPAAETDSQTTNAGIEEKVSETNNTVNGGDTVYSYLDADGNRFESLDYIPCESVYYYCIEYSDGTADIETRYKTHSYKTTFIANGEEYASYDAIPCESEYRAVNTCEVCGATRESTGTVSHAYTIEEYYSVDGVEYSYYNAVPCETDYIEKLICSKCGAAEEYNFHKSHLTGDLIGYVSEGGTPEYDSYDDIPCLTGYYPVYKCKNCGQKVLKTLARKEHEPVSKYTYTDENGVEYTNDENIPCGLNYIAKGTCRYCGEAIEISCKRDHIFEVVCTTSDGTEYYSEVGNIPKALPCGSSYKCVSTCINCGLTAVSYGTKEHHAVYHYYTATDGTQYESWDDIPCQTAYTDYYICNDCAEDIYEPGFKSHTPDAVHNVYIVDSEEHIYNDPEDIKCGRYYRWCYTCAYCGEDFYIPCKSQHTTDEVGYVTEDYEGPSYYLEDGTEISGYQDSWPDCHLITKIGVCTKCGNVYSELFDTHDWVETDDGTVCSICGIYYSDLYSTDGIIARQTASATAKEGETVLLNVYSQYVCDYFWQYSTDGGTTWQFCEDSLNDGNYSFIMDASYDGRLYRCEVSVINDPDSRMQMSDSIPLSLKSDIKITSQPADQTVVAGNSFSFKVAATGSGLTYLWEYSTDGGATWTATTRTKNNYGTKATNAMNGRMFRCIITDENGDSVISDPATLTVKPAIEITAQPVAATVKLGEKFSIKVTAKSNNGSKLSYLWQYSKTLTGWTDTTRTLNNYGTYATLGVDGKYFRCKITDEAGNVVYSQPAMVRVLSDITITQQPADTTVASGKRFYFTVTATGSSITYKWEYSKDGGKTWLPTTRTKNNYTTYAKSAMNGWKFRCIITDSSNNTVTTSAGTLTVK